MPFCRNCGKEISKDHDFCKYCGERLIPKPPPKVKEEDFINFIGKNSHKYLPKFKKFNIDGVDRFSMTWNWPAFFFGFSWILYRKLYLWFLVALPTLGLYVFLIAMPVWGMIGNYIYYRHAKKKILGFKTSHSSSDLSSISNSLRKIGGVKYGWAAVLGILWIIGVLAAIFIPPFLEYLK